MNEPSAPDQTLPLPDAGRPAPTPADADATMNTACGAPVPPADPPTIPLAAAAAVEGPHVGRYEVRGEIGRGGMGCVLRGHDPLFGRELAIKVLLEGQARRPELVRRFVDEARIAGRLQHPGLVPVHELGVDGDRLFFSMKLVEGRTLSELLRARGGPADDLSRFLTIFEQVCQAVGYAHSKGVIHRDLKPSNVMVGAFGEVQVMDWGLAKVLPKASGGLTAPDGAQHRGADAPRSLGTLADTASDVSQAGAVLGTPGYMPPEQARGETEHVDERSDVFGLGAILCEILTARPPFGGDSTVRVLEQAMRGDVGAALARLDGCGADAALVQLARRCLAADPAERPADGSAVAAAVSAYRAGVQERLHAAEVERAAAQARAAEAQARARAERHARRMTLGLAALVLLVLLLGGGGFVLVRHLRLQREALLLRQEADRQRQEAELSRDVEADLARVALDRQAGKWEAAWHELEHAEGRLASDAAPEALRQRVTGVRRELEPLYRDQRLLTRLEEARVQRAAAGRGGYDNEGSDKLYRAAFADYGLDPLGGDPADAARRIAASAARDALIVALDDWASTLAALGDPGEGRLRDLAGRADDDDWRRQLRAAYHGRDWETVGRLAEDGRVAALRPSGLIFLADALQAAGQPKRALDVLREGQRRFPSDFWITFRLGKAYQLADPPAIPEALRYYAAALALRPDSLAVRNNLALVLYAENRLAEAEAEFREALRLRPDYALARTNLGLLLHRRQRDAEAGNDLPEAVRLKAEAEKEFGEAIRAKPDLPLAYKNLGNFLRDEGRPEDAEKAFRDAVEHAPNDQDAYFNLAYFLKEQKKDRQAEDAYRKVLEIKPDNALAHNNLGVLFRDSKRLGDAEKAFAEAVRVKPDYALGHNNLGDVYRRQGKWREAEAEFRTALRLRPDFPAAHYNLVEVLRARGRLTEAEEACAAGLRVRPNDAELHYKLGLVRRARGNLKGAQDAFRDAVVIQLKDPDPLKSVPARLGLGDAYRADNRLPEAETIFRKVIELQPNHFLAHYELGVVLSGRNQLNDAEAELKTAAGLQPDNAGVHESLGDVYRVRNKLADAEREYREVIRISARSARAHERLADTLRRQGRFPESLDEYRRARELASWWAGTVWTAADRVRQAEHLVELERRVPALLSGDDRPSGARELDAASRVLCNKRYYAAAVRFAAEAFRADAALENDLSKARRYDAACAAVLAGCGQGIDPTPPDEAERVRLRRQALAWLRADLDAWTKRLESGREADRTRVLARMRYWRQDGDLAPLRGTGGLAWLPAGEREEWQDFWHDVDALRKRAEAAHGRRWFGGSGADANR